MKYPLLLKASLAIVFATCMLLTGTMYVFASSSPEKDITLGTLSPNIKGNTSGHTSIFDKLVDKALNDGTTPPTAVDYADKFDVYTHVTYENGKSVVTIYTAEQINELQANPANILQRNEAIYLLDDTMKLFASYDIVRVTNINGEVETYNGARFYMSDEYYNSFGSVDIGSQVLSYDLRADVLSAMLSRLEVLSSASVRRSISGNGNEGFIYLDCSDPNTPHLELCSRAIQEYYANPINFLLPEEDNENNTYFNAILKAHLNALGEQRLQKIYSSWLNCRNYLVGMNCGVVWFEDGRIYYVEDLSRANYHDVIKLYPGELSNGTIGNIKYDANEEKAATIEVWESATKTCVARIRLDNINNPGEIAQMDALWLVVQENTKGAPVVDYATVTDYRVAVYLNGFSGDWGDMGFCYNADGNLDQWSFNVQNETLQYISLTGSAAYVNQILEQMLKQ